MQEQANRISDILVDYFIDNAAVDFQMSSEHIINWVNQFEEGDREFILEEFLHLLNKGIYISKERARELLLSQITSMSKQLGYGSPVEYLSETVFLDLQPVRKSQGVLLNLLNDVLIENYGFGLANCGTTKSKNYIYIDDIMASGKTILSGCKNWLEQQQNGKTNLASLVDGEIVFKVIAFCVHSWAKNNILISLKMHFKEDKLVKLIGIHHHYLVNNNIFTADPDLNLIYPLDQQSAVVENFLQNLTANNHENRAYRKAGQPSNERFFSNPENRNRFEKIIMNKGVEILNKVVNLAPNQRPLGNTYPSYKTFGTGTMFFTWRNVSNTCPIVFWWNNPAHDWFGLFPLYNRGI